MDIYMRIKDAKQEIQEIERTHEKQNQSPSATKCRQ